MARHLLVIMVTAVLHLSSRKLNSTDASVRMEGRVVRVVMGRTLFVAADLISRGHTVMSIYPAAEYTIQTRLQMFYYPFSSFSSP